MKNNQTTKKSGMPVGKMLATGAGAAALGAGAYYFLGPKGKAHQKKASTLMAKMKKEVAKNIKKAETATTPIYHKTVDMISNAYAKQYKEHEKEIKAFAKILKSEWQKVAKEAKKPIRKLKKKSVK